MKKKETVYCVGIGGIGMSALVQLYLSQGKKVLGSDRGQTKVTRLLEKKGVKVFKGHDVKNIPEDATLLVYSDAVPKDNVERVRARELGVQERSYFEALGEATKKVSSDFKQIHHVVPWKEMAGMRDKLIHDYIGVDIHLFGKLSKRIFPSS